MLDRLKNARPVGFGSWLFFQTYDQVAQEMNGKGGVNINFASTIGPFGVSEGTAYALASFDCVPFINELITVSAITLGKRYWGKPPDVEATAVFAHETAHLLQGFAVSLSTQAEIAASEVEYLVWKEQGPEPPSFLGDIHKLWLQNNGDPANFSDQYIEHGRQILLNASNNNLLYQDEVGRPILSNYYHFWFGNGLNTVLNAPGVFQGLGQNY